MLSAILLLTASPVEFLPGRYINVEDMRVRGDQRSAWAVRLAFAGNKMLIIDSAYETNCKTGETRLLSTIAKNMDGKHAPVPVLQPIVTGELAEAINRALCSVTFP